MDTMKLRNENFHLGANYSDQCAALTQDLVQEYINILIPPRPVTTLITMLACFSALGVLGNALVLYVYVRKRNKLSSTVFIIALAATDLVTSAVSMPYTMTMEALNYQVSFDFCCKFYYFVITCTVPFSVFIMVAIAIDRYLCICRPHSRLLDSVRAKKTVLALLLLAVIIGVIPGLFYGIYLDDKTLRASMTYPLAKQGGSLEEFMRGNESNLSKEFFSLVNLPPPVPSSSSSSSSSLSSCSESQPHATACQNETAVTTHCPDCADAPKEGQEVDLSDQILEFLFELVNKVCSQQPPMNESYILTERCLSNQLIFSDNFRKTYQTFYSASFLVCFSVVFVLYLLIYRSVLVRRSRRLQARSKTKMVISQDVSLTENNSVVHDSPDKSIALSDLPSTRDPDHQQCQCLLEEHTHLQPPNHSFKHYNDQQQQQQQQHPHQGCHHSKCQQKQNHQPPAKRPKKGSNGMLPQSNSGLKDKYFLANIRTAIMLFVVTLAFVIAFLPSWLMAFKVINFNVLVFYVYFSNHIVNPIIYAFMNPAFRRSLYGLLCRKHMSSI